MGRLGRGVAPLIIVLFGAVLAATPAPADVRTEADVPERGLFAQHPLALASQQAAAPAVTVPPRADCISGQTGEGPMQGRVPGADIAAGKVDKGWTCNLSVIGHSGSTGGFRVHRYIDKSGHECAYYDTTLLFPTNATSLSLEPTGVAVLDMTDPAHPVRTDTLSTPAMQTPHESVNISVERGLLAAVMGNPAAYPGVIDIYDISKDCRHPELDISSPGALFGHESGMAPDGKTFYPASIGTGQLTAVDISNPRLPLPIWQGNYNSHGLTISEDGNRAYVAATQGMIILDISEIQARKPNPQVREISRLAWPTMTIPQNAIPVTIKGKPYVVEVDEFSQNPGQAQGAQSVAANGAKVGAARIIDISDERHPFVVSDLRLAVHQPENRAAVANDPGAQSVVQGYAGHYCNVPQRHDPGIVACSMIMSGLRVFDIRDPKKPKELAYYVAPPSTISATGGPVIDERSNWAMSQPAFAPERGEIWYSDGNSGFWALKMDPKVWPFPKSSRDGCVENLGFLSVAARGAGRGAQLAFTRRASLPVRIDVFRTSAGRRVVRERLVARFANVTQSVSWNGKPNRGGRGRSGAGVYFVRFTMLKNGKPYDTRRVVLARDAAGRFSARPTHYRRDGCGLVGKAKLQRPVFGGSTDTPLTGVYRLSARAKVTITVSTGKRVVKRFATASRAADRTLHFSLPAKGLARGDYTVRLLAQSGEQQQAVTLAARRL